MNNNELKEAIERLERQMESQITALREEFRERIEALESPDKRGPKADRAMTAADAFRVKFGDLNPKVANHKEAALALGLSYGQVFSARGGYTFKTVKADWKPADSATAADESKGD